MTKNLVKHNLLVTLADKKFIKQAKQLFSSVYWNAGWEGDYMLLAHEIPEEELKWFRDKGILIKECTPLYNQDLSKSFSSVVLDKFYLFTEEFKKWNNVIFLDSDIVVKAPLEKLTRIKSLAAARDICFNNLYTQFSNPQTDKDEYLYDLSVPAFNSGVMSFNTDIIGPGTFGELNDLFKKYISESKFGEQLVLNLYFYKKWKKLPAVYNFFINYYGNKTQKKAHSIIIHFARHNDIPLLGDADNSYYQEWKTNLERAEFIDLNKIQKAKKWKNFKIKYYSFILKVDFFVHIKRNKLNDFYISRIKPFYYYIKNSPGRIIGNMGAIIKKYNPDLYYKLKGQKKK